MGAVTLKPGATPDRALDLLQIDGGWLTIEHIAHRLGVPYSTTQRALYRLRERGWVDSRVVDLGFANRWAAGKNRDRWAGATFDTRLEWRALLEPSHWFETT